jgi:PiT family inorganic phosphate transporter
MTVAIVTVLCAACVAWANGSNDVSKGVATLVGSRLASYRQGLAWGTVWTVAGAVAALALTSSMINTFSTALVAGSFAESALFPLSVATGAFVWVLIASWSGLPVSTTHSLAGAIVGTAIAAGGVQGVNWMLVFGTVAVPLAVSPFLAAGLSYIAHAAASRRVSSAARFCVCVAQRPVIVGSEVSLAGIGALRAIALPLVIVDHERACAEGRSVSGLRITDAAHWVTSATLSFARGLNDTPKIVALGLAAAGSVGLSVSWMFGICGVAMGAGSLLAGRRVSRTLAEGVTEVDPLEGLSASAVAATLVLLASAFAMPVSTTQVASGAIVGVGLRAGSRAVRWPTVFSIVAGWLITLPVSALVSAAIWRLAEATGT